MEVLSRLNAEGMMIVAVLHDLALASRYAHRVVGLAEGEIVLDGPPSEVFTPEGLERLYGLEMVMLTDPRTGRPLPFPA